MWRYACDVCSFGMVEVQRCFFSSKDHWLVFGPRSRLASTQSGRSLATEFALFVLFGRVQPGGNTSGKTRKHSGQVPKIQKKKMDLVTLQGCFWLQQDSNILSKGTMGTANCAAKKVVFSFSFRQIQLWVRPQSIIARTHSLLGAASQWPDVALELRDFVFNCFGTFWFNMFNIATKTDQKLNNSLDKKLEIHFSFFQSCQLPYLKVQSQSPPGFMVAQLNEYWNPEWSVWRKSHLLWSRPCEDGKSSLVRQDCWFM